MFARVLRAAFLAGCCALGAGCGDDEPMVLLEQSALGGVGSARVDLPWGSLRVGAATLVLSGEPDFTAQTRQLRVSGPDAQRSVFFGCLPAGIQYRLELLAGSCRGEAEFVVEPNRTTQVTPQLSCASEPVSVPDSTLPAQVPGSVAPAVPPVATPDCVLIQQIVAQPALQRGNSATSTILVIPVKGVSLSGVEWSLMEASSGLGLLFSSPSNGLAVGFDCERDGVAGIVAGVSGSRDGRVCRQQGQTQIHCVEQSLAVAPGATPGAVPPLVPPVLPPQPPAEPGACGACARDYCAPQLAAVEAVPAAEPVLSCVLGSGFRAGDRASAESCGNLDLLSCYCGSAPAHECEQLAPAELDGQCREQILSATGCSDSRCVGSSLLDPTQPSGAALRYLRCQQDFCYDLCFNY